MKTFEIPATRWMRSAATLAAVMLAMTVAAPTTAHEEEGGEGVSFDNLERIEKSRVANAYVDPNADFSVYQRVMILDPYVAFRKNWQRDVNRSRSRNIRGSDMERIKADVAALFKEVFTERLQAGEGFEVVDEADHDVLLLRPAIIDLDITAPDTMDSARSRTFSASTGAATLYIELYDSVSGAILGRAADRQGARNAGGTVHWSTRVTNSAEARRIFARWADLLRSFLEKHYTK